MLGAQQENIVGVGRYRTYTLLGVVAHRSYCSAIENICDVGSA